VKTRVLLLDVEGTVCPVEFVQQTLFPYARARLAQWVAAHAGDPLLAEISSEAAAAVRLLERWSDEDRKVTALKTIQGRLWREGYERGELISPLYDDVAPAFEAWAARGARLAIYSSGSVEAQRLLFAHSSAGDLTPKLSAYFDTTTGPKRAPQSYATIAESLGVGPGQVLFCSDTPEELEAAAAAGVQTCLIAREAGSTLPLPGRFP
jgi:enolase-phosphatase E1